MEYWLMGLFLLAYLIFLFRTRLIAKRLRGKVESFWIKLIMRLLAVGFIFVAIFGPSFGKLKKEVKSIGKDIFIAIDLSKSMDATDILPSRIQKAKFEIKSIIDQLAGDRIGLIIFSSEAYLYSPLTFDKSSLFTFIETLNTNSVSSEGTDFGQALKLALDKFLTLEATEGQLKTKLILLISDGEDFGDDTESVLKKCSKNDVKVFTLGIGTRKGGNIPLPGGQFLQDENGEVVVTKLNDKDMKAVAEATDGAYFEISDMRNDVQALIAKISALEGEVRSVKTVDASANKFIYPLLVALFFIVMDILFTVKIIRF
jgi:Ca-activated chloride channel family protein